VRKGLLALVVVLIALAFASGSSASYAPLEEQPVLPACLIAQTHPPLQIPLCDPWLP